MLKHPVKCPLQSYVRESSISLLFPVRSHRKYTPSTSLIISLLKNRGMTTSDFIVNSPRNILAAECTKEIVFVHYNKIVTRKGKVRCETESDLIISPETQKLSLMRLSFLASLRNDEISLSFCSFFPPKKLKVSCTLFPNSNSPSKGIYFVMSPKI